MRRAPLQAEADTTLTDNNGDTALQHAEAEGHESVAQLIRLHEVEEGVTRSMCDICVSDEKTHMEEIAYTAPSPHWPPPG